MAMKDAVGAHEANICMFAGLQKASARVELSV